MIYVEIDNDKVISSTSSEKIAQNFKSYITTNYDDYTPINNKYCYSNGEIILNPNYETEQLKNLEKEFDSQFFEIPNFGYFRRIPKGYNSAVESLNTVCSAVTFMKSLPEDILTFYRKPDFTKPEQCTEEWITNNSYKNKAMTLEEFAVFYTTFITAWNTQEHL